MIARPLLLTALSGLALSGLAACTTTGRSAPAEVIRYHLGEPIPRGTVAVEPLSPTGPASIEFKTYAAAVETELLRSGYATPAPGAQPQFIATVAFTRANHVGPPRQSPVSIGLGGGGFSGGRGGGGVGLGGGLSFPLGSSRGRDIVTTELTVTIKRRADQSPVWEGSSRTYADARAADATASSQAAKLAGALFTGFPGESGRTIEVK
ncbi:DUF4136 domain-containing protein [Sphingomonas carotinifaciens]|uniref:DUF4136 domain-containing protein n=1 Tax=Sphingomonas carotinifaciens TaxID=1166323 RepID=A0A1G7NCP8_9SPHN|nr:MULTISPECIES: DUF4136 domain-containing protein [Sphingomonas]MBB4087128.1 hypothetical protein [Sphingomonas carotinifaciens]MWC43185.1 DUF4136 domain-containing protein [Sphingomonas carotinifaciens]SDF71784.1 protein of unknown function [Sphingomonas carotinifaciens]